MLEQRVTIAPSTTLAVALGAVHLAAAGSLWLTPIPVTGKVVFTLAIGISLIYFMAHDALLHASHSVVALDIRDDGTIALQNRLGEWIDCDVLDSSYISHYLTVINFLPRGQHAARHVILVPDNVDAREFRRLRMWLRWKRGDGSAPAPAGQR